jgi:hypothetical protein
LFFFHITRKKTKSKKGRKDTWKPQKRGRTQGNLKKEEEFKGNQKNKTKKKEEGSKGNLRFPLFLYLAYKSPQ